MPAGWRWSRDEGWLGVCFGIFEGDLRQDAKKGRRRGVRGGGGVVWGCQAPLVSLNDYETHEIHEKLALVFFRVFRIFRG